MQLSNSPSEHLAIRLERRKSFSLGLWFTESNRRPVDISGASVHFVAAPPARPGLEPVPVLDVAAIVSSPEAGYARVDLQASHLDLAVRSYDFAVVLVSAGGYSTVVAKGELDVQPNTSADATPVYTSANPPTSLDIRMLDQNSVQLAVGALLPPNAGYLSDEDQLKLNTITVVDGVFTVDLSDYASLLELAVVNGATVAAQADADAAQGTADAALANAATAQGTANSALANAATAQGTANTALANAVIPPGTSWEFSGATPPAGWLLEDGASHLRASYPALFAVIGTSYGSVDGTHFNVPDHRGRVGVGLATSQTEFDTLGKTGGEKTHLLLASEMPSHTHVQNSHNHTQDAHAHGVADPGHSHTIPYVNQGAATRQFANLGADTHVTVAVGYTDGSYTGIGIYNATATNQATTATNQSAGGGGAHNNLQPYITKNFIIKT